MFPIKKPYKSDSRDAKLIRKNTFRRDREAGRQMERDAV